MQSAAPDRPFFEIAMQRIMERRTRVQLLFRQAGDDRIAVFDVLLAGLIIEFIVELKTRTADIAPQSVLVVLTMILAHQMTRMLVAYRRGKRSRYEQA
jgi:hypothetical protein